MQIASNLVICLKWLCWTHRFESIQGECFFFLACFLVVYSKYKLELKKKTLIRIHVLNNQKIEFLKFHVIRGENLLWKISICSFTPEIHSPGSLLGLVLSGFIENIVNFALKADNLAI